jgi:glycerophosphoryl diester phosphodiesterase
LNKKAKIFCAAGLAVALPIFVVAPGRATKRQKAPFNGVNFAHRGLHSRDKLVPENSLAAFRLAANAGYGVEMDVHLSKDGQVVVFHDDTLDRVCGVSGRVEDYTFAQLQEFRLCGTEERIPLFSEVLAVIRGRGPIILEIKDYKPNNKELCRKVLDILNDYRGAVCIESFNPLIVAWFRFHAKDILRGQLSMPKKHYKGAVRKPLDFILSHCLMNFVARPQFIAYKIGPQPLSVKLSQWLGAMKVGWTSHEPRNEQGRDAVIFEFYKPEVSYK